MIESSTLNALGAAQLDQELLEKAEESLINALVINNTNIYALNNFGELYEMTGNLDTARDYLKQALEIEPENTFLIENLRRIEQAPE